MIVVRRDGFRSALEEGVVWYAGQQDHDSAAAEALAERFAKAVDATVRRIEHSSASAPRWIHREGYRFKAVTRPFQRWQLFYRQPDPEVVELIDLIRGERDLPRRVR